MYAYMCGCLVYAQGQVLAVHGCTWVCARVLCVYMDVAYECICINMYMHVSVNVLVFACGYVYMNLSIWSVSVDPRVYMQA